MLNATNTVASTPHSNTTTNTMHSSARTSSNDRFTELDIIIEKIGHRPLARKAGLSGSHVNRILRGDIKDLTVATATKIARAAQITLDDVIFYVERQKEYARRSKAA